MKKRKLRPFARRLTRSIMWTLLIVMGLASYFIYSATKDLIKEEELDLYRGYLKITHAEVNKVVSNVRTGVVNHVSEIEDNLDQPERLSDIMSEIVTLNPYIRSCGVSFVDNYYPQKGHWFCPYAVRTDSGQVEKKIIGSADHDYLKAKWFTEAVKADSSYWSKPFFDATDSVTPLVSYMMPIHDKRGQTVAILGADLSLNWFSDKLIKNEAIEDSLDLDVKGNKIVSTNSSEKVNTFLEDRKWRFITLNFIIDADGTFVAYPVGRNTIEDNYFERAKETTDTIDDHVGHMMVAGKKGFYSNEDGDPETFSFFGIEYEWLQVYMFYEPVEETNWSVALAVPGLMVDGFSFLMALGLILLIGLGMFVVRIVGWFVIRRATKPLKQLALSAKEVARGNFNAPLPEIKRYDEIHLLRDSFEDMQHSLTKYIDELKSTTASKAAIENELRVAHDIQMDMLPKTFPPYPERDDIDIYGKLTPAKDVGGDLFDFYIRDEKLFFCVGDVSGKGVPASLVMAVTRSLFRNISTHTAEPSHIVYTLNNSLLNGNDTNMFVTCFVGVLNLTDGIMQYCNAGHNIPLLIGQGVGTLPCDPNVPLGVVADWEFTEQKIDVASGTTIFLYTDGLNEAENTKHDQFDIDRVIQLSEKLLAEGKNSPEAIISKMIEAVHNFVAGAEQSDDMTMLAIRYLGNKGEKE